MANYYPKPLNDDKFFIHLTKESNGRQKPDSKHVDAKPRGLRSSWGR